MDIDDDRRARGADGDLQPMGGRRRITTPGEIVEERIADFDRDARLVGALRGLAYAIEREWLSNENTMIRLTKSGFDESQKLKSA
jgi:hypothetical protein